MQKLLTLFFTLITCSLYAQPGCDAAIAVSYGVTAVPTYTDSATMIVDCVQQPNRVPSRVAWFTFTPDVDTLIRIGTGQFPEANDEDTRLSILTGSCGDLTCLAGNDDGGPGTSAQIDFEVNAGVTYYLVFDNMYSNDSFLFNIEGLFVPPTVLDFSRVELERSGDLRGGVDMNGDYLDDIVSVRGSNIQIHYQTSDGSFNEQNIETTLAPNLPSWSLTAGDINSDGYNDLIYGGGSGATFMLSDGNNGFVEQSPELYIFCQRGNCVDINNDGLLDVFMCHDIDTNVFFINEENISYDVNRGLGTTAGGGNYGSIWIDYDNDRDLDLFIAKCRGGNPAISINQLHRNNGDGTFTEVAEEMNLADDIQTWSSAWGDYDNDGDLDVFVGASSLGNNYHRLMRNDDSTFTDVSIGSGLELIYSTSIENTTHDFNNDGFLDIYGAGNVMLINNGDMTFTQTSTPTVEGPIADVNNDGFLDILNAGSGRRVFAYLNTPNENNYLKITTAGTISNPNGIGARVELYTENGKQIRDVRSGDGFRFMSSLNTHFGIGTVTEIEKVMVYWPSGVVDEILNPEINSTLHVIEGAWPSASQEFEAETITLYPNPTANIIRIPSEFVVENALVDIFDVNGKLLIRNKLSNNSVDVSKLASGTYQLIYRHAETIRLGKFVKR